MFVKVDKKTNAILGTMKTLPKQYTFSDGRRTGNFDIAKPEVYMEEGFYPLVVKKDNYNPEYQALVKEVSFDAEGKVGTLHYIAADISVENIKHKKGKILSEKRNSKELTACTYKEKLIYCNEKSLNAVARKISALSLNSGFEGEVTWYCDDGDTLLLNLDELKELQVILEERDQHLRDTKASFKAAIETLSSSKDVSEYDIEGGW